MGRGQRVVKIIGPRRIAAALVLGVAVTVLTAWWIALNPQVIPRFPFERAIEYTSSSHDPNFVFSYPVEYYWRSDDRDEVEITTWEDTGNTVYLTTSVYPRTEIDDAISSEDLFYQEEVERPDAAQGWRTIRRRFPDHETRTVHEIASGWPCSALTHRFLEGGPAHKRVDVIHLPRSW